VTDIATLFDIELAPEDAQYVNAIEAEAHPIAATFPPLPDIDYRALVEDIATHGQRDPISSFEGKVLDGVQRQRACRDIGVPVRAEVFEGTETEAIAFAVSKNLRRRHLIEVWQGAQLAERLRMHGLPVNLISPTAKSMSEMWSCLARVVSEHRIALPENPRLRRELSGLTYTLSPTGIKVESNPHADIAVTIGMLCVALDVERVPAMVW